MTNRIQKQKSGDHSLNVQIQGISYSEARTIAMDVYKANFLRLAEDAATIAARRAEALTDAFLVELRKREPQAISSMSDPGMQMALFTAQREYAKTGNKSLERLLVDLLADRAEKGKEGIERIVLDESINVVSKLTSIHLDSLSVVLLMTRAIVDTASGSSGFRKYIQGALAHFIHDLSDDSSCYEHLEYAGCGSIMRVARWPSIEEIFIARFSDLFKGQSSSLVRAHVFDRHPELRKLFDLWPNGTISRFNLTTVGVSIAQANCRRKIGQKVTVGSPVIAPYVDEGH